MSKTLNEIKALLSKAYIETEKKIVNMAQVISCVDRLEKFPMSRSLLESTRIGRVVNDLRKATDERTTRRIKGLIRAWQPLLNHLDPAFTLIPSAVINGSTGSTVPSSTVKKSSSENCLSNFVNKKNSYSNAFDSTPSFPDLSTMSQVSAVSVNSKSISCLGETESGITHKKLKRVAVDKTCSPDNFSSDNGSKRPRLDQSNRLNSVTPNQPLQNDVLPVCGDTLSAESTDSTAVETPIKLVIRFSGHQSTPPTVCNNVTWAASSTPSPPLLIRDCASREPSRERSPSGGSSCERSNESGQFPTSRKVHSRLYSNATFSPINGIHDHIPRIKSEVKFEEEFLRLPRQQDLVDNRSLHSGSSAHTGTTRSRGISSFTSRIPKVKSTAEILSGLDSAGIGRDTYNQILNNELVKEPDLPPVVPLSSQPRRNRRSCKNAGTALNPLEATADLVKQSKRDILNKFLNSAVSCGERVLAPCEGEELEVANNVEQLVYSLDKLNQKEIVTDKKGNEEVSMVSEKKPNLLHSWPTLPPLPEEVDWESLDYSLPDNIPSESENIVEHSHNGLHLVDGRFMPWTESFVVNSNNHLVDVWPWVNLQIWPCQPEYFPSDALNLLENGQENVW